MADDDLWSLVERTRPTDGSPRAHADALVEALVEAGPDIAVAVDRALHDAVEALRSWDLWGAFFLLNGGCSDDAFEYLRCWVVGQGRERWEQARTDPEQLLVDLVAGTDHDEGAVVERLEELWLLEGEPLLYVGTEALTRLGVELAPHPSPTAGEPTGEPWEEDDLPRRFPRLTAALPPDWYEDLLEGEAMAGAASSFEVGPTLEGPMIDVIHAVADGLQAFADGDHDEARALLDPLVDDPDRWRLVAASGNDPVAVAYAAGMGRFLDGDPDGAARVLSLVSSGDDTPPHVRRGIAQVHLARGDLEGAAVLLDESRLAQPMDRALRASLLQRRGDRRAARRAAKQVLRMRRLPPVNGFHPWDVAGMLVQVGFVLVELEDGGRAGSVADDIAGLTADGPDDLPLKAQGRLLRAAADRLLGDADGALVGLGELVDELDVGTCDLGMAQRELARCQRVLGDPDADATFAAAGRTLRAAGERWLAEDVAREAAG